MVIEGIMDRFSQKAAKIISFLRFFLPDKEDLYLLIFHKLP
jgi:hypothetical protein